MRVWRKLIAPVVIAALACGSAQAHPQDEVVQGAYLTLAPGEVRLQIDLIAGVKVAGSVLKSIDANGDRRISDTEARAYAGRVLAQSSLKVNGAPVTWRLASIKAPAYENIEQAGETIEIYAVADRRDEAGAHSLAYENRYDPATCLCIANVFLEPGSGWQYQVNSQTRSEDGRAFGVSYLAARP
jgi:hypothetical protein